MTIQGAREGRALVAVIDKASDPQENVAELLTSSGFAAPVLVTSSMNQQADLKPLAEVHGEMFLQFEVWYKYDIKACLKYTRWIFFCILSSCFSLCTSVPSVSSEALAWRSVELPVDGQTVSLLASVIENPQEFYCHMSNGKGTFYLLSQTWNPKIIG